MRWVVDVMSGSTVTDATKVRWEIVLRLAARNVRTLYANNYQHRFRLL